MVPFSFENGVVWTRSECTEEYRQIFVYIFCVISICTLVFTPATKFLVLNIERTLQNYLGLKI